MKRLCVCAGAAGSMVWCAAVLAQPASFTPLGDLAGGSFLSRARAVSGNGQFIVGGSSSAASGSGVMEASLWDGAPPCVGLGDIAGGAFSSEAYAVSADGSVVFGFGTNAAGQTEAFRWTSGGGGGMVGLGFLAQGGSVSRAFACAADGFGACGEHQHDWPSTGGPPPLPTIQAIRWTSAEGMTGLGFLPGVSGTSGGEYSTARGMSADGSVIVGYGQDSTSTYRPWRWTQATGIVDISGGVMTGFARGCSPDGSIVVGSYSGAAPFAWTSAGGMRSLGLLAGYASGSAVDATNDDGRVLAVMTGTPNAVCVWDRTLGMPLSGPTGGGTWRSVASALSAAGVSTAGWALTTSFAMSDDGKTIVGYGTDASGNTQAWKAVLPRVCLVDFDGVGGVGVADIFAFLNAWFAGDPRADYDGLGGITVQDIFEFLNAWFVGC